MTSKVLFKGTTMICSSMLLLIGGTSNLRQFFHSFGNGKAARINTHRVVCGDQAWKNWHESQDT